MGPPPRISGLAWHRDRDLLPAAREFVATTERVCAGLAGGQPVRTHVQAADSTGRNSSA